VELKQQKTSPGFARWPWLLFVFLPLAVVNSGHGFLYLARGNSRLPDDFPRRWREEQYVLAGKNPYDILFTRDQAIGRPFPAVEFQRVPIDPAVGILDYVGYPPWTYFTGVALHSAPLPWGRYQYAAINLIALVALVLWAVGEAPRSCDLEARWFLPISFLATMPFFVTLTYGQYGVIVLAMLACSARLSGGRCWWLSGLLLGVAMLKPTMAAAFFLLPLARRRWGELIVAAAYTAVGCVVICAMTRTSPILFLAQMESDSTRSVVETGSLLKGVWEAGVPLKIALPTLIIALGAAGYLWIRALGSRATILDRLAIAGFIARLYTYHRPYDDLLLTFLLVALAVRLIRKPAPILLAAMLLVGLSLWLPLGFHWRWPALAFQHFCWFVGVAVLNADILSQAAPDADIPEKHKRSLNPT
jgi:glycosyl transferase family 87